MRRVQHGLDRRLHCALDDLQRVFVEVFEKVSVLVPTPWVFRGEEAVVQAHFARDRRVRRHPLDDALDLLHAFRGLAGASVRVVGGLDLGNLAAGVLDDFVAGYDVREFEPHRAARGQPEESLWRILAEVVGVDVNGTREWDFALPHVTLRVHVGLEHLHLVLGPVGDGDFDRIEHRKRTHRLVFQRRPCAVLQHRHVDVVVGFADSDSLTEELQRSWCVTPSPDPRDGWHARIRPAVDVLALDELNQLALRQNGVLEVEARELCLARVACDQVRVLQFVQNPVVERAMVFKLEGAQRVRDLFQSVRNAMREVVHRVDAPLVACHYVRRLPDPVECRVSHVEVRARHVDFGAQTAFALLVISSLHLAEHLQILLHRPVAVRGLLPGRLEAPTVLLHLVGAQTLHVRLALLDQVLCGRIEHIEVVRGVPHVAVPGVSA
mmetsp:Transcript_40777/g.81700  ORF Transcript_40777/g.81700 Transcript_40777/m.81700 type:complete len:437 (+) Transcript_40777:165-1475(+)